MIDLHCHTNYSDGSLTPAALLERASDAGIRVLAITDHDTMRACALIAAAARERGIQFFSGVELSTRLAGSERSVHLLGYFGAEPDPAFLQWLHQLQQGRAKRNAELLQRLQQLGFDIEWSEVTALAQRQVGRPHFSQVLLRKGYVRTLKEAFERYLGEGALAWVERDEPPLAVALGQIRAARGIASLAHPVRITRDWEAVDQLVGEYAELGLEALECFHSEHSREDEARLLEIAQRYGLGVTGGSDFHGDAKPEVALGTGVGGHLRVPAFVAQQLSERLSAACARVRGLVTS